MCGSARAAPICDHVGRRLGEINDYLVNTAAYARPAARRTMLRSPCVPGGHPWSRCLRAILRLRGFFVCVRHVSVVEEKRSNHLALQAHTSESAGLTGFRAATGPVLERQTYLALRKRT